MRGGRIHPAVVLAGYSVLAVVAALTLLPFFWLVTASVKLDTFTHVFLPPIAEWRNELSLSHYQKLFLETGFFRNLLNSAFLATTTTLLSVLACGMGGFALAKYRFPGQNWILGAMLVLLVFPGEVMLGPTYEIMFHLGWMDTYWALIVPGIAPAFGIILFRQAFRNVPDELFEAARMDGASELGLWWKIAVPQVRPMIGAFGLFTFLGNWNAYLWPQIVLRTEEKLPLPVALAQLRSVYETEYGLIMAGTAMSILPVVVIFLLFQRDFVSGLSTGAIK